MIKITYIGLEYEPNLSRKLRPDELNDQKIKLMRMLPQWLGAVGRFDIVGNAIHITYLKRYNRMMLPHDVQVLVAELRRYYGALPKLLVNINEVK